MSKQKLNKIYSRPLIGVLIAGLLIGSLGIYGGMAKADQFDDQIKALQDQNTGNRAASNALANQASSYQQAIDALQGQIDSLRASIAEYQKQSDETQKQIDQAQIDLDQQKLVLGENIKTMYLEGKISTLEILASSKDLSHFVDKEVARNAVQSKVKDSVDKINALKQELQDKETRLQGLIKDQQNQQTQLASNQAEQNGLLAYTEGQKATYDKQIKTNNSQIASLRAAQAAANRKLLGNGALTAGDPNHGNYPSNLNNAAQDSMLDPWGMYNRECVSYTAWKVYETYGYMPYWGGQGNANQWPGDARRAGIPTGSTPQANSVAIWNVGVYGHAMWVDYVNDNGTIHVSQYNFDYNGHYSEMTISSAGLTFIYFGS